MQHTSNYYLYMQSNQSNIASAGSNAYDESCMHIIANVLSKLASTECGYFQLLFNDSKQNFKSLEANR